jgi:hypothetical protein
MSNFRVLLSIISAIVLFLYGLGAFSQDSEGRRRGAQEVARAAYSESLAGCVAGRAGDGDCSVQ